MSLPVVSAKRYVQPLREGGSLPAVVDTDGGLFVVKFRGAGQGLKALVAEVIVAALAEAVELTTPEIVLVDVHPAFGRSEPDPEIQDLLRASHGVNVGLRYLDGAFNFEFAAAGHLVDEAFATRLVWLDAFVTNPDRTHRNTNLLVQDGRPWLIDHGAALYAHHDWSRVDDARVRAPFPLIGEHVLLAKSGDVREADPQLAARLREPVVRDALARVPDELLAEDGTTPGEARERYARYLLRRLEPPRAFVDGIVLARERRLADPQGPIPSRR